MRWPAGRWGAGKSNRPLALGRGGVCGPATPTRPNPVEHCRRAAGQRGADAGLGVAWAVATLPVGQPLAQRLHVCRDPLGHQLRLTVLQHAADLSAGWRTDPAIAAVVCGGARAQSGGGDGHRLPRRGRLGRDRRLGHDKSGLDPVRVHPAHAGAG